MLCDHPSAWTVTKGAAPASQERWLKATEGNRSCMWSPAA